VAAEVSVSAAAPWGWAAFLLLKFRNGSRLPTTMVGGFKVVDANGQSLAYVYSRENESDAHIAQVLSEDEARRIASKIAKLPELLGKQ
jgi:hypothetical protein